MDQRNGEREATPAGPQTGDRNYVIRVLTQAAGVDATAWNALLGQQGEPTPFLRHEYLAALEDSGCACEATGWSPRWLLLEHDGRIMAACVLYLKDHSMGEFVFDWEWARAYARHGLPYYPKAVLAVPFTPVPGARLLAVDDRWRGRLAAAVRDWCAAQGLPSLHALFLSPADQSAFALAGLLARATVQFHWHNTVPAYADFEDFLAALSQDKRKKIRQERRKVAQAGVQFRALEGAAIDTRAWDFFYRCYAQTYAEHGNPPYLTRAFFGMLAQRQAQNWVLFVAARDGQDVACSLIALQPAAGAAAGDWRGATAFGRYWGALERVDCLHFEACYYQPLQWCIAQGCARFEGGAQGEHKLARALLPVRAHSAHWLAHPGFASAVAEHLALESRAVDGWLDDLQARSPLRQAG